MEGKSNLGNYNSQKFRNVYLKNPGYSKTPIRERVISIIAPRSRSNMSSLNVNPERRSLKNSGLNSLNSSKKLISHDKFNPNQCINSDRSSLLFPEYNRLQFNITPMSRASGLRSSNKSQLNRYNGRSFIQKAVWMFSETQAVSFTDEFWPTAVLCVFRAVHPPPFTKCTCEENWIWDSGEKYP